jgi:hypothetical protein
MLSLALHWERVPPASVPNSVLGALTGSLGMRAGGTPAVPVKTFTPLNVSSIAIIRPLPLPAIDGPIAVRP